MLTGEFAAAAQQFAGLARGASNARDAALARELASLCRTWDARGVVFIKRNDLGESSLAARNKDERTTDEIASLYLNAVVYGLGTGAWLAVHVEPNEASEALLPALGLAGAAAGGVALLDYTKPLRYGVGQSIVSGMYIGLEEGLAWTLFNQARSRYEDQWTEKTVANLIWASVTLGALGGGVIGSTAGATPGRAAYVGTTALWGGAVVGLFAGSLSGDRNDERDDAALLGAALGVSAGAVAGALTAGRVSPSIARVRFLDLGGIAGGLVAGGLYISAADSMEKQQGGLMATTALGIGVGLGIAWLATAGMPTDRGAESAAQHSAKHASSVTPTLIPTQGGGMLGLVGVL